MKKKIIIATCVLLLAGMVTLAFTWQRLLLKMGGYETPQLETTATIAGYAAQHSGSHFLAIANDKDAHAYLRKSFGVPGLVVFDKQLLPIGSSAATGCPGTARYFLDTLRPGGGYAINRMGLKLQDMHDVTSRICFVHGDSARFLQLLRSDSIDYVAVYAWAKFLPAQSVYMMEGVEASSRRKKNILVLSLNLDYADRWTTQDSVDKENSDFEISFAN